MMNTVQPAPGVFDFEEADLVADLHSARQGLPAARTDLGPARPTAMEHRDAHSTDLLEIAPADLTSVILAAQRVATTAVNVLGADGVNLLNCCGTTAWQTVFHFHMHVIPRYRDKALDRLTLPFEPGVPGRTEEIRAVGARLRAALT